MLTLVLFQYCFFWFSGNNPRTLKVKLDTVVEPDSEINKQDATEKLYNNLRRSTIQKQLSKDLSDELDTELEVDKVYKGSVMIELRLKDYTELENIKSLSDTGVLSNIFGSLLLTSDYLSSCLSDKVHVDAKVDDRSYQALMAYSRGSYLIIRLYFTFMIYLFSDNGFTVHALRKQLPDKISFLEEEVKITCDVKNANVKW